MSQHDAPDVRTYAHHNDEEAMPLTAHLEELRKRLQHSIIAILVFFVPVYSFSKLVLGFLQRPVLDAFPPGAVPFALLRLPEGFFTELKASFLVAILLASPFLLFQVWRFIAPGLYPQEKRFALPMMVCSSLFFFTGAAFAYYVVFPFGFAFFLSYAEGATTASLSLSWYLTFCVQLLIAFGLVFQLPIVVLFLSRLGLVTAQKMRSVRKFAILVIFIVAAILTPPDVITQLFMAGPMMLLYELSIIIAQIFGKKRAEAAEEESCDV